MNHDIYYTTTQLIADLVRVNHNNRQCASNLINRDTLSPIVYAREFCTVHFDVGRRTGKTTYIIQNATDDSMIIVHHESIARYMEAELSQRGCKATVRVFDRMMCEYDMSTPYATDWTSRQTPFTTVYVDEPRLCLQTSEHYNKLYEVLASSLVEQTFILLGQA